MMSHRYQQYRYISNPYISNQLRYEEDQSLKCTALSHFENGRDVITCHTCGRDAGLHLNPVVCSRACILQCRYIRVHVLVLPNINYAKHHIHSQSGIKFSVPIGFLPYFRSTKSWVGKGHIQGSTWVAKIV